MTGLLHKGIKLTGAQKLIVSPNTVCRVCRTPLIMVPHILDGRCPVSVSRLPQTLAARKGCPGGYDKPDDKPR
jgi:hypothetical protein